jgi:hypothetical protein
MLYRTVPEGRICITQPTHAWVSGQLARAWGNEAFGYFAPWEEVCLGAEQHDIGWLPWDVAPTWNPKTGYPHGFTEISTDQHVKIWSGASRLASPLGRYAALLISLHGTRLYERHTGWKTSPTNCSLVERFLKTEAIVQQHLIDNLKADPHYADYIAPEAIAHNRKLIAIWDAISLMVCMGLDHDQTLGEVPTASEDTSLNLSPTDSTSLRITVKPWPFQRQDVTLTYEGRILYTPFPDEDIMYRELPHAPWVTMTTMLVPA